MRNKRKFAHFLIKKIKILLLLLQNSFLLQSQIELRLSPKLLYIRRIIIIIIIVHCLIT